MAEPNVDPNAQGNTVAPDQKEGEVKAPEGEVKAPEGDNKTLLSDDKNKVEGAPEKYADFTLPENVVVNPDQMTKFTELAKEANMSQENAQKFINLQAEVAKEQASTFAKIRENWVTELKSDKDFGGEKFDETVTLAKRALDTYFDPELKTFLDDYGFGDNSKLIIGLAKIGKTLSEQQSVNGAPPKEQPKSAADIIYGPNN